MHSGSTLFFVVRFFCIVILITGCSSSIRYSRDKQNVRPSFRKEKKKSRDVLTIVPKKETIGIASYYGPGFHGKKTANGEQFNMYNLTAAHKTLPFNTIVNVINLKNNKSIIVRINDRGPFKKGRIIDLSYGAAKKIGLLKTGISTVKIIIVP